jgi:hypothetical protein
MLGRHFTPGPDTVGLARRQKQPGWPGRPARHGAPSMRSLCGRLPTARWWMRGDEIFGGAPVERGEGAGQYLNGGVGAGRRGDGDVAERARPGGARRCRRGCGGRRRWRGFPTAPGSQEGGERRPKIERHRVVAVLTGEEEEAAVSGGRSAESNAGARAPTVGLDQR